MVEVFLESLLDSIKVVPFLLITYLVMGMLEGITSDKSKELIKKADKIGPVWGSIIGVFPQCGFGAAASYFYIGRVITLGTLISIYLATSDEMLPIMISAEVPPATIAKILLTKVIIGVISGFVCELLFGWLVRHNRVPKGFDLDAHDDCHCGAHVLVEAVIHTCKAFGFIFVISLVIGVAIELVGQDSISLIFSDIPVIGEAIAALVGLIPNCAASVVITQLYLDGIIGAGPMISGLLVSAGVGLLVLFKENNHMAENLYILGILYGLGVVWGCIIDVLGISF